MIVSLGIFTIVAVVAIGALLKIVDANKKSQSLKTSITNLNFVLDSMTREMRVGTDYYCVSGSNVPTSLTTSQSCSIVSTTASPNPWTIAFNSSKTVGSTCNLIYAYYFDGAILNKAEQSGCGNALTYSPITPNDPNLDSIIRFDIAGINVVTSNPNIQPYAQFHLVGSSGFKEKTKTTFDLETTVSQRLPN